AQEEKVEGELRARSAAENRAFDAAAKQQAAQQAESVAGEEERFQSAERHCLAAFEQRKVRINEAHKNARRQALARIGEEEGRRKHRLQQNALEAERRRDTDLGQTAVRLEEFKQNLAATAETYAVLERETHSAFRGYRKFRKLLAPEQHWPEPDLSADEDRLLDELRLLLSRTGVALNRFACKLLPMVFMTLDF